MGPYVRRVDLLEAQIRQATRSGTPLGGEAFLAALEKQFGRRSRPGKPGRPQTASASAASV